MNDVMLSEDERRVAELRAEQGFIWRGQAPVSAGEKVDTDWPRIAM